MTRGHVGRIALLTLAITGAGCASRKEETAPPADARQQEEAAVAKTLECSLSGPAQVKAGEPVELVFKLTNPTKEPLYVLKWHTPLEGIRNNIFTVTRADSAAELSYGGPMMKRGPPDASSYATIAPGESVEGTVDAALAYGLQEPGTYRITFRGPLMDVTSDQAKVPALAGEYHDVALKCPEVVVTVT
ncbi:MULTISPECIES: protease [Myxococcus]|uniref:Protease n=1 Tax=Myxococcus llanfairpwllgwyngyllgogerychwyrndrobwllllantysiliogogogochensis TaxID=2590453 RepID=A0A540WQI0_9BACT|nr:MULTISPECIES: protease [Myxococcus]NTX03233.1 protease [Myxococcus sp. CA040A]NTX34257.1 protease [Myxococcus sp. CA033]TQF11137.1 protease [Myxococcus llanfairpwllgwyngyllgogerychwyrndrobwllllantysiliogogogochensis]